MKPLRLKNLKRNIRATRGAHGVPRIEAESWTDALYGLGYMHATDRGTQLLFARSVASGRGAEEISDSPELLQTDRFFRRIGLHLRLEEEVAALTPEHYQNIEAYCSGVNDGLKGLGRSLPMWATGFEVHPWDHAAVLLVGKLLSFGGLAVSQLQNERLLLELIHAGANDEGLRELLGNRLDNVDFDVLRKVKMANELSNEALELLTDLPRLAGSNAWAVSPKRSQSGFALLASDPHLEVNRLPAIWYEAVLTWGNHYTMGASLPGCPLIAVGRSENLAWGVTYMKGDTIDFFIEDCRLAREREWQYRRGKGWQDFKVREEVISRKGAEPETLFVYENEQGTLESDPGKLGGGYLLSIGWTGSAGGGARAMEVWMEVAGSSNTKAAMDAARDCTQPTLCWVFADRQGHIGLQGCGRHPQRGGGQVGLAPIPAWDPKNHWRGWWPKKFLPRIYDPPEGFVATANEEMNPPDGPMLITQILAGYRKRRIDQQLSQLPAATLTDMQTLQYDVISVQADDLLRIILPHLPQGKLRTRLTNWDRSYTPESQEAALFQKLYFRVLVEIFGHERGLGWRRTLFLLTRSGYSTMLLTAIDRVLAKEKSIWWRHRDKAELIRRAAQRVDEDDVTPWSEVNRFYFTDRFFGSHNVGRLLGFNSREYPMRGCHATPFQGHLLRTATRQTTFAPSYHFVTDLGANEAWTNLPGGPSESRFSRYYKSDLPLWLKGEYKRIAPRE